VPSEMSDADAKSPDYAQKLMASLIPGVDSYEISHTTLYRVHQRVASRFRLGRVLLAGDAAHINNPLGGMGMNGGIHDAVNLTDRLGKVWRGEAPESEMDRYEKQRREITLETIQKQTIQNKQNLEAKDPAAHEAFKVRMRETANDPKKAYEYLLTVSMIASLRRAAELG
jgi:3-(3-hydroxy-phenyl)propionate hydroxylase